MEILNKTMISYEINYFIEIIHEEVLFLLYNTLI
jgi:hypothetical protein